MEATLKFMPAPCKRHWLNPGSEKKHGQLARAATLAKNIWMSWDMWLQAKLKVGCGWDMWLQAKLKVGCGYGTCG